MEPSTIEKELREQRELLEKIFVSTEKSRKYFLWTMWGTMIVFVIPLIILIIAWPFITSILTNSSAISGLGL